MGRNEPFRGGPKLSVLVRTKKERSESRGVVKRGGAQNPREKRERFGPTATTGHHGKKRGKKVQKRKRSSVGAGKKTERGKIRISTLERRAHAGVFSGKNAPREERGLAGGSGRTAGKKSRWRRDEGGYGRSVCLWGEWPARTNSCERRTLAGSTRAIKEDQGSDACTQRRTWGERQCPRRLRPEIKRPALLFSKNSWGKECIVVDQKRGQSLQRVLVCQWQYQYQSWSRHRNAGGKGPYSVNKGGSGSASVEELDRLSWSGKSRKEGDASGEEDDHSRKLEARNPAPRRNFWKRGVAARRRLPCYEEGRN